MFTDPAFLLMLAIVGVVALGVFALVRLSMRVRARDMRHLGKAATEEPVLVALRPFFERLAFIASMLPQQGHREWARRKLRQANLTMEWTPELVETMKLAASLFVFVGGLFFCWFLGFGTPFVYLGIGAIAAYFIPDLMLISRAGERQEVMRKELPFVIDLIAVSSEAGLAFQQAIRNVVQNASRGGGEEGRELISEFENLLNNLQMGRSLGDALMEAARRVDLEEFSIFVNSILQADRLGTPVSETLKRQSDELREKMAARVEAKANQAPVKILFPLIIFIFPVTAWVIVGPVLLRVFLGEF